MDWDLELRNSKLENMIIIYQEEIKKLEEEKDELLQEVTFLKKQLEYKTMGKPKHHEHG
jgi:hypothetical protein|tara:strand:+ start:295 stop:471 length:177 start_codon:yes stop_codon:yes gene_type:complete